MATLKQKTISGLSWSFIGNISNYFIVFIVGIILARLLEPSDFGLIGMVVIFTALAQAFVDSGFSQALIRKQNCTQTDYSTVFYFNFSVGILMFLIIFFSAEAISHFYHQPQLTLLIKVLAVLPIISSFGLIQRTILTKNIDFKLQTRVTVFASVVSGTFAIIMAYAGWGVWSLVFKNIMQKGFEALFLWIWSRWTPSINFSIKSFKVLFGFGSKMLLSGLLDTAYVNIYLIIIGKYFSATELGYYTRADQFKNLPSQNLTGIIQSVSYPVLSTIQDDKEQLKRVYKKLITSTMFITFSMMIGMAAIAKPLVLFLIGIKWAPSIIYLQLLCFVGVFFPLSALNLNILKVLGHSNLFLRLEIIKKILVIPFLVFGVIYGMKTMIIGMIVLNLIAYYINSYWSGKLIGYSILNQIMDILPSFLLALFSGIIVFTMGYFIVLPNYLILLIQITCGSIITISISELFHIESYINIKSIVLEKLSNKKQM